MERSLKIKNHLNSIGSKVEDQELSRIALRGLPLSWEAFIQVISRPSISPFDQLKNDCTSETSRLISRGIISNQREKIKLFSQFQITKGKRGNLKERNMTKRKRTIITKEMISPKLNVTSVRNSDIPSEIVQKGKTS